MELLRSLEPLVDSVWPPCVELVSEFCRLLSCIAFEGSSPKKVWSFLCTLPAILALEPVDDTVVALAIEGRLSSPSITKLMPLLGDT